MIERFITSHPLVVASLRHLMAAPLRIIRGGRRSRLTLPPDRATMASRADGRVHRHGRSASQPGTGRPPAQTTGRARAHTEPTEDAFGDGPQEPAPPDISPPPQAGSGDQPR